MVRERAGAGASAAPRWRGGSEESEEGLKGAEKLHVSSVTLVSPVDTSDSDICKEDCFCIGKCGCFCGVSPTLAASCCASGCCACICACICACMCCCTSSAGIWACCGICCCGAGLTFNCGCCWRNC